MRICFKKPPSPSALWFQTNLSGTLLHLPERSSRWWPGVTSYSSFPLTLHVHSISSLVPRPPSLLTCPATWAPCFLPLILQSCLHRVDRCSRKMHRYVTSLSKTVRQLPWHTVQSRLLTMASKALAQPLPAPHLHLLPGWATLSVSATLACFLSLPWAKSSGWLFLPTVFYLPVWQESPQISLSLPLYIISLFSLIFQQGHLCSYNLLICISQIISKFVHPFTSIITICVSSGNANSVIFS